MTSRQQQYPCLGGLIKLFNTTHIQQQGTGWLAETGVTISGVSSAREKRQKYNINLESTGVLQYRNPGVLE